MSYMFDPVRGTFDFSRPLRVPGLEPRVTMPSYEIPRYFVSPDKTVFDAQRSYVGRLTRDGRLVRDEW